jgi:hypothetical protein
MLYIAFYELARRRPEQMLANKRGFGMNKRHHILQLIAESESSTGLIVAAAPPQTASYDLIYEPAIDHYVEGWIWRLHLYSAERAPPVTVHAFQNLMRYRCSPEALDKLEGILGMRPGTKTKDNLPRLAIQQLEWNADSATGIKSGTRAS